MIDGIFTYLIDKNYLEERGELLAKTTQGWLEKNNYDAIVSFLTFAEEGEFIVDYSADVNNKDNIKNKVEELLNEFNISYKLKLD